MVGYTTKIWKLLLSICMWHIEKQNSMKYRVIVRLQAARKQQTMEYSIYVCYIAIGYGK